eukprot:sb/3465381/
MQRQWDTRRRRAYLLKPRLLTVRAIQVVYLQLNRIQHHIIMAPVSATPTKVKKAAPKKPSEHPQYKEMIAAAIAALANRSGSSKIAISKYISANYKVGDRHESLLRIFQTGCRSKEARCQETCCQEACCQETFVNFSKREPRSDFMNTCQSCNQNVRLTILYSTVFGLINVGYFLMSYDQFNLARLRPKITGDAKTVGHPIRAYLLKPRLLTVRAIQVVYLQLNRIQHHIIMAPVSATPTKVKKAAPKKPSEHPQYKEMIAAAIAALANRSGSSKIAISKYISANYKVGDRHESLLRSALLRGLKAGALVKKSGVGCSGSFKLAAAVKKPAAKKPAVKKPAAKKPAAKKAAVKKAGTPKKAAPKKKTAAAKKSTPKKKPVAAKKKPVAKKATPKKAKK